MIIFTCGDILQADVEAIVNTVNCVGVMGRGIALQFRKAWPENFKAYAEACKHNEVQPGRMFVFDTHQLANPRYIINFPTKRHWRGSSRIEDIEAGLIALVAMVREKNIKSIAIPPLGSGLGGLDWNQVKSSIQQAMHNLTDVQVIIYEPYVEPENDKMASHLAVPKMTPGRAVLVELIQRYLAGLLDPTVSLLEVHKLMYFMQEAGEPLRLQYKKGHYGPYAENLRHVLHAVEGHFVSGYADGDDNPNKQLQLVPGVITEASDFLAHHMQTRERFNRVSELVAGFESPFGLELLSTVHWLWRHEKIRTTSAIIAAVHAWNNHKLQFTSRQIELAIDVLTKKNWLNSPNVNDKNSAAG